MLINACCLSYPGFELRLLPAFAIGAVKEPKTPQRRLESTEELTTEQCSSLSHYGLGGKAS